MNPSMKTLYTCMLNEDIIIKHIITEDPNFFLRIDFFDYARTSIGFYEKCGKIAIKAFVRDRPHKIY